MPGESQGQRSLAGYSPWGRKESDRTEATARTWEPASRSVKWDDGESVVMVSNCSSDCEVWFPEQPWQERSRCLQLLVLVAAVARYVELAVEVAVCCFTASVAALVLAACLPSPVCFPGLILWLSQ